MSSCNFTHQNKVFFELWKIHNFSGWGKRKGERREKGRERNEVGEGKGEREKEEVSIRNNECILYYYKYNHIKLLPSSPFL